MFEKSFLLVTLLLGLLLAGCAPMEREIVTEEPTPVPVPGDAAPVATPDVVQVVPATPTPAAETAVQRFDPKNPDWKLRYEQLKKHYARQFEAPSLGQPYDVMMLNGRVQQGILEALGEDEMTLKIAEGSVTFHADALAESSRSEFFRAHYAHLNALARGRAEYAQWQALQESRQTAVATPVPQVSETAGGTRPWPPLTQQPPRIVGGDDGLNVAHRLDPNAPPPKNEGPKGRVWQVDQYIRKNAAIPHSLRYIQWGKVTQQGDKYTVRVKYTLESAEGLGTSTEDMIFFMYADGNVFRKAANKTP
jgi:hypothetical protein